MGMNAVRVWTWVGNAAGVVVVYAAWPLETVRLSAAIVASMVFALANHFEGYERAQRMMRRVWKLPGGKEEGR